MKNFSYLKSNKKQKISYYFLWAFMVIAWIAIFLLTIYSSLILQWSETNFTSSLIAAKILLVLNFFFILIVYSSSIIDITYYFSYFIYFKKIWKKQIKYLEKSKIKKY